MVLLPQILLLLSPMLTILETMQVQKNIISQISLCKKNAVLGGNMMHCATLPACESHLMAYKTFLLCQSTSPVNQSGPLVESVIVNSL